MRHYAVEIVKFTQNTKIALEKPKTLYRCAGTHTSKSLLMKDQMPKSFE